MVRSVASGWTRSARGWSDVGAGAVLAALLLWAAVWNRFPLVFPDSGTYLGIAFGQQYAVDRSSFYGLALKPFVNLAGGAAGLWIGLLAQSAVVAAALIVALRVLAPGRRAIWLAPLLVLTSLPFHAGQFMPDALTGAVVIFAWAAALRDPAASGAPLLWLAAVATALTHYTHAVLMIVAALATIVVLLWGGLGWRLAARRLIALALAASAVFGIQTVANGRVLGRWSPSPMGSVFLFARLHEDGPAARWLARHCGRDAPAELCAVRTTLPRDSQILLWNNERSPLARHIWYAAPAERWRWVDMLGVAARGALHEEPGAFAAAAIAGSWDQFRSFAVLDDECPVGCRDPRAGITSALLRYRPETVTALHASRQVREQTMRPVLRAITSPVAIAALLLLPVLALTAARRRDAPALALLAVVLATLAVNAAMAGALSDVHDRYQSRIVWLAPLTILLVALRSGQTFSRWRISLPGLK